ncbi:FAD-binding oxidoreductase [Kocuria turfanensis]|uniref:FAD-linked oxidase n=1 Tax=Kocuria turfanensis TaxID=388357 RepID=A0A512IDS2_9MICC|nr:FAD-binding protein [Kocuria turfanensis]GEO95807.1 FAD-linked oxidase [Kocuria turfanensis]
MSPSISPSIPPADVGDLRQHVAGPVLTPQDDGYETETAAYNLATPIRPDVVVGAQDADDVAAAVAWAAAHHVPLGVQATGHGADVPMQGGLLISTARLQECTVDPQSRTARVGAGVRWRSVLEASVPHGLVGLSGSTTDVGVVGYTLGGGLPVLGRTFGFAADHVRSFEVVTPDGRRRAVDAAHEPELFGLLRGGKGNLGVVTAMEFELLPLDGLYGGAVIYPGAHAREVLTAWSRWTADLPESVSTSIALLRLPAMDIVPEPLRDRFVVHLRYACTAPAEEAERLLAPMRALPDPVMDTVGPMSYRDVDAIHMDPPVPIPYRETGRLLEDVDDDAVDALLAQAGPDADCPLALIEIRLLGGALSRAAEGTTDLVAGRDGRYVIGLVGLTVPPHGDRVPAAIEDVLTALGGHVSERTLVNFLGSVDGDEAFSRAWSSDAGSRLRAAKDAYDPENLLRFQHAVRP